MAKKILQDMVKTKDTVSNPKKNRDVFYKQEEAEKIYRKNEAPRIVIKDDSEYRASKIDQDDNGPRYGLWSVALIAVVFLLFAISFLFSGAKVTVIPKTQDLTLSQNFNAIKDSTDVNSLPFDLAAISGQETVNVQGGEAKDVLTKATGMVKFFNAFNTSPQTLALNTKLEGSNGKIYKIQSKIIIPGMAKDGTPGSIEVGISGAEVGAEYDSDPLDFRISGFKGTSKYSKIYAESDGKISGGLQGKFAQISDDQKTSAINDLRSALQAKLLKKITDQIPDGYILFKDAVFLNDDSGSVGVATVSGSVPVTLTGTLYGFLFEENKLAQVIVKENVDSYDGSPVYVSNIRNLIFSLVDKENISFKDVTSINFTLTGSAKVVWKVDTNKLIDDLLNKRKGEFNQILAGYSNIASADSVLTPIWSMSFPGKSKDINVIVNYPK